MPRAHLPAVLALALAPGQVFTVDDDGPADFDDLPPAIAAAQPGDVLLVAPGAYSRFDLDRPLRILGAGGILAPIVLDLASLAPLAALALDAGGFGFAPVAVLPLPELAGLTVPFQAFQADPALYAFSNAFVVRVL